MRGLRIFTGLLRDQRGTSAVEYGIILALIVLAMLTALRGLAGETLRMWNFVETETARAHAGEPHASN
jgi:pilus assembly protein Flp/PilA